MPAALLVLILLSIPPAASVLAVAASIYAIVQFLKMVPALAPYLKGWKAMALNVALGVGAYLVAVKPDQLYTLNTLYQILEATGLAAGIHGTVRSFKGPSMLAETGPDGNVKEVPAILIPKNPADIPVAAK